MPKVKLPRKGSHVDMTAMCDVAFLLLTFFMLATKFKPQEPVVIRTPASTSTMPIPNDYILLSLSKDGKVFFSIDNLNVREELITEISTAKGLNLNAQQIKAFKEGGSIGVPFNKLPSYLSLTPAQRNEYDKTAPGIPTDTTDSYDTNELAYWIKTARYANAKLRIAIKADGDAKYPEIQKVIATLGHQKVFRFNFITDGKGVPPGSALAQELATPKAK
ncbi:biopolymer transporter ExbD [Taibaiella sp. KBW10]|uniref:ExbD/TolR family protein n=1 Tax=Taibaiella sp. KBW10 TaxID=2153357 RepID=UPI000F5A50BD|nr:biopolymer transporter ExbD [Taibaiella sp. KBW10]RQO32605.1 biopolymer transporter ExbD [Taibaiella sp. KBW10]